VSSDLISVIVPTFSRSEMLPRALTSILNQSYKNFEIIVVDDNGMGSLDQESTYQSIIKFLDNTNVRYVAHEKNLGGSEARNTGIRNAEGRYITFLDDDDEYYVSKLETQLKFYQDKFPDDNGFINGQIDVAKNGKIVRTTKSSVEYDHLLFSAVSEKILGTPTFFIPKEILVKNGGFPIIAKGQEWYLSVKLIEAGYSFQSMCDSLVKVNIHNEGSIFDGNKSNEKQLGGLNAIYEIQKSYFEFFNIKQQHHIKYKHCLALARSYSKNNLLLSIRWLIKSLRYGFPQRDFVAVSYHIFLCRR